MEVILRRPREEEAPRDRVAGCLAKKKSQSQFRSIELPPAWQRRSVRFIERKGSTNTGRIMTE
jgi:hypothetical protein